MIVHSISDNTRYKNLDHFGLLTKILQKDWVDVTEEDLRALVANIMTKHGENGKESGITCTKNFIKGNYTICQTRFKE